MDIKLFLMFMICIIFFVVSIVGMIYYYRRVKSWTWTKIPTTKEYTKCLVIGWFSLIITIFAGVGILFIGSILISNIMHSVLSGIY